MEPFLPWPGSKAKHTLVIISEFPEAFRDYYEPFLGSGSIFFGMNYLTSHRTYRGAHLSDINPRLIRCWRAVKDKPETVKKLLENHLARNSEEYYYEARKYMDNPSTFLYVMRAAFSSMYRENQKGEFNVPYRKGDFASGRAIGTDMERISACSEYLRQKNARLSVANWITAVQDAGPGDVVYFDPPYLPYTEDGFVTYVAGGFSEGEHLFLAAECKKLAARGVFVALSGSAVPASFRLYGEPRRLITTANSVKANAQVKGTRQEGLWIWSNG